jgi:hypothetical protein
LLSADQLAALASGPLPSGIEATEARRSQHRDLYLDTADDSLRRRGIVCRLRTSADGDGSLTLLLPSADSSSPPERVDVPTGGADVSAVLVGNNGAVRRLRGLVDPATLQVRVDLEVDRLTRWRCATGCGGRDSRCISIAWSSAATARPAAAEASSKCARTKFAAAIPS